MAFPRASSSHAGATRRPARPVRRRFFESALTAILACAFALIASPQAGRAENVRDQSAGQTVYVPVWPNVFFGPRVSELPLAATLQVHNVDPERTIELLAVDYYDFNGKKIRSLLDKEAPLKLTPLAARSYHLTEEQAKGDVGANFLVKWRAAEPVNVPIIEAVMIGVAHGQGISFISMGEPISEP
jgi:hypothetical protein